MSNTKEIQRRIKSIRNTRKITRAMEMVAAAKMKKQVDQVLAIRDYAHSAWGMLANLSRAFAKLEKQDHELLAVREVKKILVILVTSNRGLCGAYNAQVVKKLIDQVKNPALLKVNRIGDRRVYSQIPDDQIKFDFIAVGKKGFQYLAARDYNVVAEFEDLNFSPTIDLVSPLSRMTMDDYAAGKYDKVVVAYTDFKNTLVQEPKMRQILPISKIDLEKQIEEMQNEAYSKEEERLDLEDREKIIDYKFEPRPRQVLSKLLPRLVEMQIYHAILESNASRESARMMAMKNATEAAGEMMQELEYSYNQIRQMNITQEIAEITSGRVALE